MLSGLSIRGPGLSMRPFSVPCSLRGQEARRGLGSTEPGTSRVLSPPSPPPAPLSSSWLCGAWAQWIERHSLRDILPALLPSTSNVCLKPGNALPGPSSLWALPLEGDTEAPVPRQPAGPVFPA